MPKPLTMRSIPVTVVTDRQELVLHEDVKSTLTLNATPAGWLATLAISRGAAERRYVMDPPLPHNALDKPMLISDVQVMMELGTDQTVVIMFVHDGRLTQHASCVAALEPFISFAQDTVDSDRSGDEEPDADRPLIPA